MEANLTQSINKSKLTLKKGDACLTRSYLELFYKGFKHFYKMNMGENFIVFIIPSPATVNGAVEAAQKRIAENGYPLQVVRVGHYLTSNTFIVKAA